jgi:phytanoyl-CoA dioxygenase PhyH
MSSLTKSLQKSRLRASYRYHRSLTNSSSRRSFERERPQLNGAQQRAIESLRADGLAIVQFSDLVGDEGLWQELAGRVEGFVADARERVPKGDGPQRKEDFIIRANGKKATLDPDGPWLRYAASERLLAVVNAYLGLWSKLTYVDQWYTAPSPQDADRIGSQRWHRDHIDRNIVKVFTYFSDVDRDAGALEYVRGSAAGNRHGHLWPWKPLSGENYPPKGELEEQVPEEDRVAATGGPGTVVLVDTGGFHRGGFAVKPRVTSIFTYVSPAAVATPLTNRRFTVTGGNGRQLAPESAFAVA